MVWEEKIYKEKVDIIKGKGNLPELPGIVATGVAGAVIPTPAIIPGPSKVSASKEIGVQMKRKYKKKGKE